jgi:hypothetical protein
MAGRQDGETPASQQVSAARDAYGAGGDLHVHAVPPADRDEPGTSLSGAAGVQVGSGNVQINHFYSSTPPLAPASVAPATNRGLTTASGPGTTTAKPPKPLKVFISYAHKDQPAAKEIEACLTACGVEVWVDEREIPVGQSIPLRISEGLSESQYVIFLMSKASTSSAWVQREWLPSLMREISTGTTSLLPVLLDDCEIPAVISDKRYADFRKSFIKGLSGLVSAFAGQILGNERLQGKADLQGRAWASVVSRLVDDVRSDESAEVALLLNTLAYSKIGTLVDPDSGHLARNSPAWVHGEWKSVQGWNAGQVLTCDDEHMCFSALAYERAVGSFSGSLRSGVIRWIADAGNDLLLFRWYQETSGSMGGAAGDTGFGVWRGSPDSDTLNGIWWYEPVRSRVRDSELTHRAYVWNLKRVPSGERSGFTPSRWDKYM